MTDHDDTFGRSSTILAIDQARTGEQRALCCLDAALEALGGGMSLDSFQTDNRKPAVITPAGNTYDVRRRV